MVCARACLCVGRLVLCYVLLHACVCVSVGMHVSECELCPVVFILMAVPPPPPLPDGISAKVMMYSVLTIVIMLTSAAWQVFHLKNFLHHIKIL